MRLIENTDSILAKAPSNIALIKYMGKTDSESNLPANASISLTLSELCTFAEISKIADPNPADPKANWIPEVPQTLGKQALWPPSLSQNGIQRILKHVRRVRDFAEERFNQYGLRIDSKSKFELRTTNTFPLSVGIASSASSFAAVTLATAKACSEKPEEFDALFAERADLRKELAQLSRKGSGSSCRSFHGPWVCWEGEEVSEPISTLPELTDLVVLVSSQAKEVSSSQAHQMITSSALWNKRPERANARAAALKEALSLGELVTVSKLAWQEMWDMHSLFHTCLDPFTFWEPDSLALLKWIKPMLNPATAKPKSVKPDENEEPEVPPIVTMDAGANLHLIIPTEKADLWGGRIAEKFPHLKILKDVQGRGASFGS